MSNAEQRTGYEIAIVGMAGRFPGARSLDQFWDNLKHGVESIKFFSDDELRAAGVPEALISHPNYVKAAVVLDDIELFDAAHFGYSPAEAEITDPQQRFFLECAWEALENAGCDPERYRGRIGVFAGVSLSTYLMNVFIDPEVQQSVDMLQLLIANDKDHVPTRVSYKLNLTGPSVNVQTACSTSLVATHLAIQSLLSGDCDMALAGGVSVHTPQNRGYLHHGGGHLSPDGHCRTFDAKARGTIGGSGVGIVALKRLDDALDQGDTIHAIIRGSAINNDGSLKIGYTAPSIEGQAKVIRAAELIAEVRADTIGYVEAHGTGTELGDPIEIAALTQAFRAHTRNKRFCAIGSVKTNIGHVDAAAGVAGLIKATMSVEHGMIPPSLHFHEPNPKIDFANSPFYVANKLIDWQSNGTPRRAAVSAFGVGGTNAHVILEEFRQPPSEVTTRPWPILLSARTESALENVTANLLQQFKQHPDANLADVAYTLRVGRKHFGYRRMFMCQTVEAAVAALESSNYEDSWTDETRNRPVAFMFPGGGNQYLKMGAELYASEPTFREQFDICAKLLKPYDLRELLYVNEDPEQLHQIGVALPSIFVIEYALARLLMSWGVTAQIMLGHSLGEYLAACLAGVLSLEDALSLVELRSRLLKGLPVGAMLSVSLPEQETRALMDDESSLAAINGPSHCVVSGPPASIADLARKLSEREVEHRQLLIPVAGHSRAVIPIMDALTDFAGTLKLNQPRIPYLSNVTGTQITAAQVSDPTYWASHLRQTVRFADCVSELLKNPELVLLEVGPGQTLNALAKLQTDDERSMSVLSTMHHPKTPQSDRAFLANTLGRLWLAGVKIDWIAVYAGEPRRRVPLPTYPFERQRYWIDAAPSNGHQPAVSTRTRSSSPEPTKTTGKVNQRHARPALQNPYEAPRDATEESIAEIWQDLFRIKRVGVHDSFFELGGSSLLAIRHNNRLQQSLGVNLSPNMLIQLPTVAKLAEFVKTNGPTTPETAPVEVEPEPFAPLLELKGGNPAQPLVLVPPLGGGLFGYRAMVDRLNVERAVYGVQAPALVGAGAPFVTVQEDAAHAVQSLQAIQPEGPYFLAGASYGGAVVFEMAQQLRAQNRDVALLVLFDSPHPSDMDADPNDDAELLALMLRVLLDVPVSVDELRHMGEVEQLDYALEQARAAGKIPADLDPARARHIANLWKWNVKALLAYKPEPYAGRVTYFRAAQRMGRLVKFPEAPWTNIADGGIEIHVVPGDHYSIFEPPNVDVLVEKLKVMLSGGRA